MAPFETVSKGVDPGDPIHKRFTDSVGGTPDEIRSAQDEAVTAAPPVKRQTHEEPAFALEPDLSSDGRDEEGEAMIRALRERSDLTALQDQTRSPQPKP